MYVFVWPKEISSVRVKVFCQPECGMWRTQQPDCGFYCEDLCHFKQSLNCGWENTGLGVCVRARVCPFSLTSSHTHQSTSAFSSEINNLDSAKIRPFWLCLWSPINWHFIAAVSYAAQPMINAPFGQRKLTQIYIITCLKVDPVWGAISCIFCHTHTCKSSC